MADRYGVHRRTVRQAHEHGADITYSTVRDYIRLRRPDCSELDGVPVQPVLAFVDAQLPLLSRLESPEYPSSRHQDGSTPAWAGTTREPS